MHNKQKLRNENQQKVSYKSVGGMVAEGFEDTYTMTNDQTRWNGYNVILEKYI